MLSNTLLVLSAAATSIAATGVLIAVRSNTGKTKWALCLIFGLFFGLTSLPMTITFKDSLYSYHLAALLPILLALPPAVHYYVTFSTSRKQPAILNWRTCLLPATGIIVMIGYWALPNSLKNAMLIQGALPSGLYPFLLAISTLIILGAWVLSSVGYLIKTVRQLRSFRLMLKNYYSNTNTIELRWVDWLIVFLVTLWCVSATALVSDNLGLEAYLSKETIYALTIALLMFLIAFATMPSADKNFESTSQDIDLDSHIEEGKYSRSGLSDKQAQSIAKRIDQAMFDDEVYLDANLSLTTLSRHVGAMPNFVSQVLNDIIGSTFYDYVAHCRIEAAKKLISEGDNSILDISLEVGFNSRSTFYKAFKKEIGMTPKAYRALIMKSLPTSDT